MRNTVCEGSVLAVTVTVLFCLPSCLPGLYSMRSSALSPGAMGCLGYSGTVHPQLPTALVITRGSLPVLVNLKTCLLSVSCMMRPKSWVAEANPMEVVGPETAGMGAGGTKGSKVSLDALVTGATAALAAVGAKVA